MWVPFLLKSGHLSGLSNLTVEFKEITIKGKNFTTLKMGYMRQKCGFRSVLGENSVDFVNRSSGVGRLSHDCCAMGTWRSGPVFAWRRHIGVLSHDDVNSLKYRLAQPLAPNHFGSIGRGIAQLCLLRSGRKKSGKFLQTFCRTSPH